MAQSPEAQIGHLIRERRKRAGHSIGELADLAGLDPSYVNHLELGKVNPTLSTITKVATALDVDLKDLLGKVGAAKADVDMQISQAMRVLLKKHGPTSKRTILQILKGLRDPARLRAVHDLVK